MVYFSPANAILNRHVRAAVVSGVPGPFARAGGGHREVRTAFEVGRAPSRRDLPSKDDRQER
jgi:hypothetical protein